MREISREEMCELLSDSIFHEIGQTADEMGVEVCHRLSMQDWLPGRGTRAGRNGRRGRDGKQEEFRGTYQEGQEA